MSAHGSPPKGTGDFSQSRRAAKRTGCPPTALRRKALVTGEILDFAHLSHRPPTALRRKALVTGASGKRADTSAPSAHGSPPKGTGDRALPLQRMRALPRPPTALRRKALVTRREETNFSAAFSRPPTALRRKALVTRRALASRQQRRRSAHGSPPKGTGDAVTSFVLHVEERFVRPRLSAERHW